MESRAKLLGHPIHQMLIVFPLGLLAMAVVFDLLAMGLGLLAAVVCGLWNGFLVARMGIQPIIATLIIMVAGRGVAQLITDGQIITINSDPYKLIGGGYWLTLPFSIFVVAQVCLK